MNNYLNKEHIDLPTLANKSFAEYQQAMPFPNICIPNFFNTEMLDKVLAEFPDMAKKDAVKYDNPVEKKLAGKGEVLFGDETRKLMYYLNSSPFLEFLQKMTGIKEPLLGDPYFVGGGLHEIKKGGFLKIHADFNKHSMTN